jgi:hypothetical protein
MTLSVRIATATKSREISLVNDYDGVARRIETPRQNRSWDLMTLSLKHAIDSTVGSLPRRELPTGLRDGNGFYVQAVYIDSEYTQQNPSV